MQNLNLVVLRSLLTKAGWYGLQHLVQVDTFQSSEYRQLFKLIEQMHDGTETDIAVEALAANVEATFQTDEEKRLSLLDMVQLLEETPEIPEEHLTKVVTKFLQRSMGYSIAEYITNHVEQESFDANVVADYASRAVDVTDRIGTTVVDLFEEGLPGEADDRPVRAGLGVSRKLDAGLRGGTGTGELVVCLAGTSIGKTSVLIKSGAYHAERGRKVLHITLEINTRKVRERYYQAWTGLTTEEIETPEGQEHCRQVRELVRGKGGVIKVIDWSYMKPTANDIGAKVRQLAAQGFRADVIIVDYLMLMAPNGTPGREYRQKFFAIAEESRALARNLDITILSAWQSTREAEKKNSLELQDFAESHDVPRICDIVVGLNANEVMRQHKRMRVQILKQRESTNRSVFELYCDMDRLVVRDITSEDHFDEVRSILEPGTEDAYRGGGEDPGA